jgi:hypothetical protein
MGYDGNKQMRLVLVVTVDFVQNCIAAGNVKCMNPSIIYIDRWGKIYTAYFQLNTMAHTKNIGSRPHFDCILIDLPRFYRIRLYVPMVGQPWTGFFRFHGTV